MSESLSYLGLSLRYPDTSGAFTELFTGPAKPSDIELPLGLSSRFLNLTEGFMMHADAGRIIYTYFNIENPAEPLAASVAFDITLLIPGRPVVTMLAELRNLMAAHTPLTGEALSAMAAKAGFPSAPLAAPQRHNPFSPEGTVAWRAYMSGSDLAAIFTFPCQSTYAHYSATLVLQPTVIANPEKSLPRLPDALDRSLWVVCPEGVSVSQNPVDISGKLTVTYTKPGFAPAEQTVDVGLTSRFARISGPALVINPPEKAGIEFTRKVPYSVRNENGEPVSSHTVLVNGRTAVRSGDTFRISSSDFVDGKAEVSVAATNFRPVTLTITPEELSSDKPVEITLSPEKRGTLLRFDFGDGRIFENSVVFEKNDSEYRLLRAGRFHGFRAHRIVGSEPETYNVEVNVSSAAVPDPVRPAEPVAPAIENHAPANRVEAPRKQTLKAPDIRPVEECEVAPAETEADEKPSGRTARMWTRRIAILAIFLLACGALAWFITRQDSSSAQPEQSSFTADSAAAFPSAEPAPDPQAPAAETARPAAQDNMGADLAYLNNNTVWRRADLTTDAGRAFFDTLVSGDIDAIASSDYFAVTGRATNAKAVQIVEMLWAAKGTGTQNSNIRVLTARKKSGEINLVDVYELLARYRDANPNTTPRPVKK